jgi:hypothetical protein
MITRRAAKRLAEIRAKIEEERDELNKLEPERLEKWRELSEYLGDTENEKCPELTGDMLALAKDLVQNYNCPDTLRALIHLCQFHVDVWLVETVFLQLCMYEHVVEVVRARNFFILRNVVQSLHSNIPLLSMMIQHRWQVDLFTHFAEQWLSTDEPDRVNRVNLIHPVLGETALHSAVKMGILPIVQFLIASGASETLGGPAVLKARSYEIASQFVHTSVVDENGDNVLHHLFRDNTVSPSTMVRFCQPPFVSLLKMRNRHGLYPMPPDCPVATTIVAQCVQHDVQNIGEHESAAIACYFLHHAVRLDRTDIVAKILSLPNTSMFVNVPDESGMNALEWAVTVANKKIVNLLLSNPFITITPRLVVLASEGRAFNPLLQVVWNHYLHTNFERDIEDSLAKKALTAAKETAAFEWTEVPQPNDVTLQCPLACTVCLATSEDDQDDQDGDDKTWLWLAPCAHSVHLDCVTQHMKSNGVWCPTCRTGISGHYV